MAIFGFLCMAIGVVAGFGRWGGVCTLRTI